MNIEEIKTSIMNDAPNRVYTEKGIEPLFSAPKEAKLVIVGQAPGIKAQESHLYWNDPSGNRLRDWIGLSREEFYQTNLIAHLPMDFYFPGSAKRGDLAPRKGFAQKWHPLLLKQLSEVELFLLIGQYAQAYYLKERRKKTLTETVKNYFSYLPEYLPLVHPSGRNGIWLKKNPWFEAEIVPFLQKKIIKMGIKSKK